MTSGMLPPDNHVARYCARKFISEDDGVAPGAFMLRQNEKYLSVQWLEYFKRPNRREEMDSVRGILSRHLRIRRPSKIAVLNVGTTCDHVAGQSGWKISMQHQPTPDNEAHSGIFGVDQDHELIAELIVETIQETHPAV